MENLQRNQHSPEFTQAQIAGEQQRFMLQVYLWMCFGLSVTGLIAMFVSQTPAIYQAIMGNNILFFGLIIAELVCVFYLVAMVEKMSAFAAQGTFLFYSLLNGLTFSVYFVIYTQESIASTFFITAGMFAAMSFYGFVTKKDLSGLGNFCLMGLIGLIIASVVNIFLASPMIYWITTYVGVIVFTGLTAYDTKRIKEMNIIGNEGTDEDKKEAIMGALTLYLDFINLFIYMLRILGDRK